MQHLLAAFALFGTLTGCITNNYYEENAYSLTDQAEDAPPVEEIDGNTAIATNISCAELAPSVDVLDTDGFTFIFDISDEQMAQMNENWMNGGWGWGYAYDLEDNSDNDTFADHLYITDNYTGYTADCGKVKVKNVGQSTGCEIGSEGCIPNLSVTLDEFQSLALSGTREFRLNNNQVGTVYREAAAYGVMAKMGRAVPCITYQWAGLLNDSWPRDTVVPYTAVEQYDGEFAATHAAEFEGGITAIWEGVSDYYPDSLSLLLDCEYGACEETEGVELLADTLQEGAWDNGLEAATADVLDWERVKDLQILHWIFWIGDDYFHNGNNVVTVKMANGKHTLVGWSYDISAGQVWYTDVQLYGWSLLPMYCQYDTACWQGILDRAPALIDAFQAADPASLVDELNERLTAEGMLRSPDADYYADVRDWYAARSLEGTLEDELAQYTASCNCDTGSDTGAARAVPPPGGGSIVDCACGGSETGWDTAVNDTAGYDSGRDTSSDTAE